METCDEPVITGDGSSVIGSQRQELSPTTFARFTGFTLKIHSQPGVPLRSTPGFTLPAASQANPSPQIVVMFPRS
jgi:hypothetical protein